MLQVRLLRQDQCIINFDAEITDHAFELGAPKQQMAGAKVAGSLVDQGHFRSPQARSTERRIESNQGDPAIEQATILPGRHMIARSAAARDKAIVAA